jgi:TolB-like protein/Tfp pilus assembly protein PilF
MEHVKPEDPSATAGHSAADRLDSWKEIAAYLKRQTRTVRRWEATEALPVHRHLHRRRATIYAYKTEIDAWWSNRRPELKHRQPERLVRPSGRPTPPSRIMLAVLPFRNLGGDARDEYFSDGLTEEMISELGRLHPERLAVIARGSVMHYKGTDKTVGQAGRELCVEYVLEGTVRREDNRVRVSAQLIEVGDQSHIWAESYDYHLTSILALQSQIAGAIARSIRIRLTPDEERRLESPGKVNLEAHNAYLKGRHHLNKWLQEDMRKGVKCFRQSIDIDPTYAPAYAGLADAYSLLGLYTYIPADQAYPNAKAAALKALELDETIAEAHAALGHILTFYDWDWSRAKQEFECALALNPSSVHTLIDYVFYLVVQGRFDEAVAVNKQAIQLDPLTPTTLLNLGWVYFKARNYHLAIAQLQRTLELDPDLPHTRAELAWNYAASQRYSEAIAECEHTLIHFPEVDNDIVLGTLGWVYGRSGRADEAAKFATRLTDLTDRRYVDAYYIAAVYAGCADVDHAMEWLTKALDARSPTVVLMQVDPLLDPLRSDCRFQDLLGRLGLPNPA